MRAGKTGEGLRPFCDAYRRARTSKERAAVFAAMRNLRQLVEELLDAVITHPGRDETKLSREIHRLAAKLLDLELERVTLDDNN